MVAKSQSVNRRMTLCAGYCTLQLSSYHLCNSYIYSCSIHLAKKWQSQWTEVIGRTATLLTTTMPSLIISWTVYYRDQLPVQLNNWEKLNREKERKRDGLQIKEQRKADDDEVTVLPSGGSVWQWKLLMPKSVVRRCLALCSGTIPYGGTVD